MEEPETQPQDTPEPETARDAVEEADPEASQPPAQTVSIEEWMASSEPGVREAPKLAELEDAQLMAVLEACVYVAEDPLMPAQIAAALGEETERIRALLQRLMEEFERPEHGIGIREVAGGYKMATKAEHHEAVRSFVRSLKPPLKLSLPALETLAVVAYKQPVTAPEIMDIRGVQGAGVLRTLLERKLISEAGRKNVIGKPILYKTTKEFLIQFGLKDLNELPTLKEFEEIRRMAMSEGEAPIGEAAAPASATPDGEAEAPDAADSPVSDGEPAAEAAVPGIETEPADGEAAAQTAPEPAPPAENQES